MTSHQIQAALSRTLVFGDNEQISAMKALRVIEEGRECQIEFRVTVIWGGEETVTIWANDEAEAREKARDVVDIDDCEIEYNVRKV